MHTRTILTCGLLVLSTACGTQNPTSARATGVEAKQSGGYMGSGDREAAVAEPE